MPARIQHQKTLVDYFFVIRERIFLGLAIAIVVSGAIGYFLLKQTPIFEARSTLLIEQNADRVLDIEQVVDTTTRDEAELENHRGQLTSKRMRDWVIERLPEAARRQIVQPYVTPRRPNPKIESIITDGLSIERGRGRRIFTIVFEHRDPEMATLIANKYSSEYIHFILERTNTSNEAAVSFLEAQARELTRQVEQGELALQEYRRSRNLVSLEQSQNLILDRLKKLDSALSANRVLVLSLEARVNRVNAAVAEGNELMKLPEIAQYQNIATIQSELESILSERKHLGDVFLERHPRMIENEVKLKAVRERLEQNIQRAISDLNNQLATAQEEGSKLQETLAQAEQESLDLDKMGVDYNLMRRAVQQDQRTLEQLLDRLNQTTLSSQLANTNFRVLDLADVPEFPVSPNPRRVLFVVVVVFGLCLVGVPILRDTADSKVKTAWDVETFINKPILGEVTILKTPSSGNLYQAVEDTDNPEIRECFRGILSQLEIASDIGIPKRIIITSSVPSEGKSFVSSNLASTWANHGYKTLLIDCDLRKPSIHRGFALKNDRGILPWLLAYTEPPQPKDEGLLNDPLLGIDQLGANLFLLKTGGSTRQPTERIQSDPFEQLMNALASHFDVVVIDTPPSGLFPDAVFLSRYADEVLYVVKYNHISRHKVRSVLANFAQAQVPVLGIVLNAISKRRMSSGYYSSYGYGYGYERNRYDYGSYGKYCESGGEKKEEKPRKSKRSGGPA